MCKYVLSMLLFGVALSASGQQPGVVVEPQPWGQYQWDSRTYNMGIIQIPRKTQRWDAPGYHAVTREGAIWKTTDQTVYGPYGDSVRERELVLFGFLRFPSTTYHSSGTIYYGPPTYYTYVQPQCVYPQAGYSPTPTATRQPVYEQPYSTSPAHTQYSQAHGQNIVTPYPVYGNGAASLPPAVYGQPTNGNDAYSRYSQAHGQMIVTPYPVYGNGVTPSPGQPSCTPEPSARLTPVPANPSPAPAASQGWSGIPQGSSAPVLASPTPAPATAPALPPPANPTPEPTLAEGPELAAPSPGSAN